MQRIDWLPCLLPDDYHDSVNDRLDQEFHLLQRARREDMGNTAAALPMLFMVPHLEDARAAKVVVGRAFDTRRGRAINGLDGANAGERKLVGGQSHNGTIFLVQRIDGSHAVARQVDQENPLAGEAGNKRAGN